MRLQYSLVLPVFILTWSGIFAQKANTVTYYKQRDGKFVKEGTNTPLDFINEPLNYPTGEISQSSKSDTPRIRIININALVQKLPNGTSVGELPPGKSEQLVAAYPHNAIVMESPTTMSKSSLRPSRTIDQVLKYAQDQAGPRASHYPMNSGLTLNELDMLMTTEQYYYYYEGRKMVKNTKTNRRTKRKALKYKFTYWPDGEIPYTVDNSFGQKEKILLESCMKDWMDNTCIRFVPAKQNHHDVLTVQNGQGCNSFVGRIGGDQTLNLEPACREYHVMKHELGHVIGLIHEHQRPDRDDFITVATENVGQGRLKNYRKFAPGRIDTFNVEYDYTSIMHYGKTAFSKDDVSTTMITKNHNFQDIIGTTSKVSFKDARIVNEMYNCAGHCQRRPFCGDGFVDKNCQCVCPDGTKRCGRRQFQGGNTRRMVTQRVTPQRVTPQRVTSQRATNQRVGSQRVTTPRFTPQRQRQTQTSRRQTMRRTLIPQRNQRRNTFFRRRPRNRSNDFRSLLGRSPSSQPRETPLLLRIMNLLTSGRPTNSLFPSRVQGRGNRRRGLIPETPQTPRRVEPQPPARPPATPQVVQPQISLIPSSTRQLVDPVPGPPSWNPEVVAPQRPVAPSNTIDPVVVGPPSWNPEVVEPQRPLAPSNTIDPVFDPPSWNPDMIEPQRPVSPPGNQQVENPFRDPPSWNQNFMDPDTFGGNFQHEPFNNFGNEFVNSNGGNFPFMEILDSAVGK